MKSNPGPTNGQAVNAQLERVVAKHSAPDMFFLDRLRTALKNSKIVRATVIRAAESQARAWGAIKEVEITAECNLGRLKKYVEYGDQVKKLAPAVVQSAIEVNGAIEAARTSGYAVMDGVFNTAVKIIRESAQTGLITEEDAQRRLAASVGAHREDEQFFDDLIATTKDANRHLANQTVARVRTFGEVDSL